MDKVPNGEDKDNVEVNFADQDVHLKMEYFSL